MNKQKHLHTNFIKFILEKYKKDIQDLPDEKIKISKNKLEDEFDEIINDKEKEVSENEEESEDDENIDTLLKEYLMLEKKYKIKKNDSLFKRK